jgi:hypothetical protein
MKVVEAISEILKREGGGVSPRHPTTLVIDAPAGCRPGRCRQERVGVGIGDRYTRVHDGRRWGVFAMQYGPDPRRRRGPRRLRPPHGAPKLPRLGKSHALGTGLRLIMSARLAAPDKFCVKFMSDAAFGHDGLDFETAVRCGTEGHPDYHRSCSTTRRWRSSAMPWSSRPIAIAPGTSAGTMRTWPGRWGVEAERVEKPAGIVPALERARKLNADGTAVLLEFITGEEIDFSHRWTF